MNPARPPLPLVQSDHNHSAAIGPAIRRRWTQTALYAGHTWADIAAALDDTELGVVLDYLAAIEHLPAPVQRSALAAANLATAQPNLHPPTGPAVNSPDSVAALAELAAEAIRSANHRTYEPGHLLVPEVYTIIGELAALAHRLPQLHHQLAANLDRRHQLDGLRLDDWGQQRYPSPDPRYAITAAVEALHAAASAAEQLAAALDAAHTTCAVIADTAPRHGDHQ